MTELASTGIIDRIRPIFGAIKTTAISPHPHAGAPPTPRPFVTISREAGAGGSTLGQRLAEHLNQLDPGEQPWACFDRELVEKVARDHHISQDIVDSLEESSHSWVGDFFTGLSQTLGPQYADEIAVYRRVAATVRALAQAGRCIIIGRGSVFVTRAMPGGVHIRLIAPAEYRTQFMMRTHKMSHEQAATYIKTCDRLREAFYKRYWAREVMEPSTFTMTLNTAAVDEEGLVRCVAPLVRVNVVAGVGAP